MAIYADWAKQMVVNALRGRNVKVALLDNYVQRPTHKVWTDVQSREVSGSGYTPGGQVAVLDVVFDPTIPGVNITSAPISFGLLGVASVNAVVFYDDTGNPATSRLLAADVFADGGVLVAGTEYVYVPTQGTLLTLSLADNTLIEP